MRGFVKGLVWIVGILAVIAGILRATIFDVWTVPDDDPLFSASVMPTLAPGDVVITRRGGTPNFADLVRCLDPNTPGRYVVGRIFGERGDQIYADGHVIKVNGTATRTERGCTDAKIFVPDPTTQEPVELNCGIETIGGTWYMRAQGNGPRNLYGGTETEVTDGNVFLVSDNRYYHYDSQDFGAVPIATCTQRIVFRLWSAAGWTDSKNRMTVVR